MLNQLRFCREIQPAFLFVNNLILYIMKKNTNFETGVQNVKSVKPLVLTILVNGMVITDSDRKDPDRMREILQEALNF